MANRDYKKIERIIKDFSLNVEASGGGSGSSNTFSIMIELEDTRMLNHLPKQFSIVKYNWDESEEGETIYTGNASFISNLNALKLDIPTDQIITVSLDTPSDRKIKLNFEGITKEMRSDEFMTSSGDGISFFKPDYDAAIFEMRNYFYDGIFPTFARIAIVEEGE